MFGLFSKKDKPLAAPEALGLRLGGAVELDSIRMKMLEPDLCVEGVATTQLIQAVGEVKLSDQVRLLRFYTDDDGYIQVLQQGSTDADIAEVKLFYFYETLPIDTEETWNHWLDQQLIQNEYQLEGFTFEKVWENERPVAMTEKTWHQDGSISETDQFIMLYERQAGEFTNESLLISCEEVEKNVSLERCVTFITGFDLGMNDIDVLG